MEEFYKINDTYAKIIFNEKVYPLIVIKKAISNFLIDYYVKIEQENENIIVQIKLNNDKENMEDMLDEFCNECLRESLRYDMVKETKNLRELIIGRALYSTCIEVDENIQVDKINETEDAYDEEYSIDEIAINWFENHSTEKDKKC